MQTIYKRLRNRDVPYTQFVKRARQSVTPQTPITESENRESNDLETNGTSNALVLENPVANLVEIREDPKELDTDEVSQSESTETNDDLNAVVPPDPLPTGSDSDNASLFGYSEDEADNFIAREYMIVPLPLVVRDTDSDIVSQSGSSEYETTDPEVENNRETVVLVHSVAVGGDSQSDESAEGSDTDSDAVSFEFVD